MSETKPWSDPNWTNPRWQRCETCRGNGSLDGWNSRIDEWRECPDCGGAGGYCKDCGRTLVEEEPCLSCDEGLLP